MLVIAYPFEILYSIHQLLQPIYNIRWHILVIVKLCFPLTLVVYVYKLPLLMWNCHNFIDILLVSMACEILMIGCYNAWPETTIFNIRQLRNIVPDETINLCHEWYYLFPILLAIAVFHSVWHIITLQKYE